MFITEQNHSYQGAQLTGPIGFKNQLPSWAIVFNLFSRKLFVVLR